MQIRQQMTNLNDVGEWRMTAYMFFLRDTMHGQDIIDDERFDITDNATKLIFEY